MNKNKLHTLSKYEADRLNRIAFMPREENAHFFDPGGSLFKATNNILSGYNVSYDPNHSNGNVFESPYTPANAFLSWDKNNKISPDKADAFNKNFYKLSSTPQRSLSEGFIKKITDVDIKNPYTTTQNNDTSKSKSFGNKMATIGKQIAVAAPREMYDVLDPVYHLAGGRESTIGNGLSETGVGLFKAGAQSGNGALMLAGAGAKVLGGLWNGAFGAKWNKENIADVENNIAQMRATDLSSVNSNAALLDAWGQVNLGYDFDQNYIGKNGWLNHKATRKYNKLNAMQQAARAYVQHQLGVAADQADRTQDDLAQSTFIYSDGGFLDNLDTSDMGEATKYSLAQDYLTMKNNKINTDAKIANMYAGTPGTFFAEGGPKWTTPVGTVGPGGFVPNNLRGTYGGGSGGGAGTGTRISDIPEYETTVQKDTLYIPVERTFNDAFRDAVRNGLDTFDFDGKTYTTKFSDNPNWKSAGDTRREIVDLLPYVWEHKKTERKKSEGGPLNVLCGGGKVFAIGGDMQTNGGDFSTGLSHINAGLSHELNPNEGVQVGVDSQGIPNLVEEGEVIWNDYVFSARIEMDDESKEVFHINKKRDITYADQAKRLEREIKERPNDPISKAAFNAQMEKLQEQQERQKAEMEAQRAQEAFAALSPEEQTAVMQQVAQQEQAAQDAAIQEQAAQEQVIAEQQAMQGQPTSEEAAMMQQQQVMQAEPQMEQQQAVQQPMMAAYGGNLFAGGGFLGWWKENVGSLKDNPNINYNKLYKSITGKDSDLTKKSDVYNALREVYTKTPELFKPYDIDNYNWLSLPDNIPYELGNNYAGIMAYLRDKYPDYYEDELNEIASEAYGKYQNDTLTRQSKKWLKEQYPNISDATIGKVANYMAKNAKQSTFANWKYDPSETLRGRVGGLFRGLIPTRQFDVKNYEQYINNWMKNAGLSFDEALEIVSAEDPNINKRTAALLKRRFGSEEQNKEQLESSSEPTYLDFSEIPDLDVVDVGGSQSLENKNNSSVDYNSIVSQFIKDKVRPSDATKIQRVFSNFTDEQKQAFSELSSDKERAEFIIKNAYSNQGQNSNSAASIKTEEGQTSNKPNRNTINTGTSTRTAVNVGMTNGDWKNPDENHWDVFTRPGLEAFISKYEDEYGKAKTQDEKNAITDRMISELNGLQESYHTNIAPTYGAKRTLYNQGVYNHQDMFDNLGGNKGFYTEDENGNVHNIADAINLPQGHNTKDRPNSWRDGLNGRQTNIRNFGSTEYGDTSYYDPLIQRFANLGATYAANKDLTYGNGYQLYTLSRAKAANTSSPYGVQIPDTPAQEGKVSVVPVDAVNGKPAVGKEVITKPGEPIKKYAYRPNLVEETNLGMYGPLVNLGMMAAGIGKPDYTELDKALAIANRPVKLASYQPIGDYIKYRPMDIWAAQNRMDANARATDRAIMNSASPSNQAALLANAYTSQLGSGELFRQSLEYNDNLKKQVADFNRGTNIQNANAFNQLSPFNASQLNADKQRRAYMAANIAGQKMDADASWYNSLYGNVNSMFTNIANREREIRDRNWMAKMAADGLLGNLGDSYTGQGLVTKYEVSAKDGGKLKRKKNKKKGLTI